MSERGTGFAQASAGRIVVATQAVEAGVDISSHILFTELAPWPSLVQRFGRCNRYGECRDGADIFWIDIDEQGEGAAPYSDEVLRASRTLVQQVTSANPADLPRVEAAYQIEQVLRRRDFLDLFNTEPDLSGFDVDISPYIRDQGSPQVQVFWRRFDDSPSEDESPPRREELCPASLGQIRDYFSRKGRRAWHWDALGEQWRPVNQPTVRPGMGLLLRAADGGYDTRTGFDASKAGPVEILAAQAVDGPIEEAYSSDTLSHIGRFVTLTEHLQDVAEHAKRLASALSFTTVAISGY